MTKYDLKVLKDAPSESYLLSEEQRFIYHYGLFNCKILLFKNCVEVIKALENYEPTNVLTKEQKEFIVQNSNKEVLCNLCWSWEDRPDIFVFGDNNIAFQVECFQ